MLMAIPLRSGWINQRNSVASGDPQKLVRPLVRKLSPYTPGEQPKIKGLIKLNTNENPYPPAPAVLRAIKAAVDSRLRLYPNPTAQPLREKLAKFHGCSPENIFVGNGSDEILALTVRAFVEPVDCAKSKSAATVQFFIPSYSLYPVLADAHGALSNKVPLEPDFSLPAITGPRRARGWDFAAALSFITTPNAPSGRAYSANLLAEIATAQRGVVILDEAYVDFAEENALDLAKKYSNVLVCRTFSKAYSLCFMRVGYALGDANLIGALDKIRDSYNVNGMGQIAALATLDNLDYYRPNFRRIIQTRSAATNALSGLGFDVLPSQTNFLLARPPRFPAEEWLQKLRKQKILVRWFSYPEVRDYLRITIGTEQEMQALLRAARKILRH
jgi:histidinol-phosphate aminotransferase